MHKDGALRGCIGRFSASEPLYSVVQQMAIASATQDHRFSAVTFEEMKELDVEISVLTPMHKINSIDEIELGKHGIYIKKGFSAWNILTSGCYRNRLVKRRIPWQLLQK
ncbi:MAG: AMMECR1 family protein [Marinilabiliales bacterium]|nr:AMMECR1 family protein [Marinilabiliales bacterium]